MKKLLFFSSTLLLTFLNANAQDTISEKNGKAVYEDIEGETSIHWPGGSTFRVNTKDASLKIAYSFVDTAEDGRHLNSRFIWGFDLSGKTNDGLLPLFSDGSFTPGFKVNAVAGRYLTYDLTGPISWITLKVGYEGARLKLINVDTSYSDQIQKRTFEGGSIALSYNMIAWNNVLFGLSVGYRRTNNYSDLDDIELTQTQIFTDTVSGTTRTLEQKITGKTGEYSEYNSLNVQQDVFWIPVPRLGIYQYSRFKKADNSDLKISVGAGAYLLTSSALSSRAGLIVEFHDINHIESKVTEHLAVSFVVGFNFGK